MPKQPTLLPDFLNSPATIQLDDALRNSLNLPVEQVGDLARYDRCPTVFLRHMFQFFGALPLWEDPALIGETELRTLYKDAFWYRRNAGLTAALNRFGRVFGTFHYITWRTTPNGRRIGATLYIVPSTAQARTRFSQQSWRTYWERAYRYLFPTRITLDNVIFGHPSTGTMYLYGETYDINFWEF